MSNPQVPKQPKDKKSNPNAILKYSGMAFQMAAVLFVGVMIGQQIDAYFGNEKPYGMLICVLLAMVAAFYLTLKDFILPK